MSWIAKTTRAVSSVHQPISLLIKRLDLAHVLVVSIESRSKVQGMVPWINDHINTFDSSDSSMSPWTALTSPARQHASWLLPHPDL